MAKYLGWRDAASTLSYIIGPALGGILYETLRCWGQRSARSMPIAQVNSSMRWLNQGRPFGGGGAIVNAATATAADLNGRAGALAFVIGMSAVGSLLASLLVIMFVHDVKKIEKKSHDDDDGDADSSSNAALEKAAAKDDLEIMACPLGRSLWTGIATVCVISFLYHIADSTFFAFYPALLQNQLGFDAKSIGMSFTGLACVSFLFSATSLSSKLIEKAGVVNACVLGLGVIGAGLLGLATSASSIVSLSIMKYVIFGAAALYFAGVPIYGPTIPTMLLQCVPPYQRGAGEYNLYPLVSTNRFCECPQWYGSI